ncbi:hypothetical protein HOD20_04720 [archaeon]|jgi:hypothetical protein|nr:hypothetical protein [archaeon]MBT4351810.1 hypothetical protein [archaeon]MBT4647706.1 hypothetical protein [archaeon]MBT6822675.1 hypothetical protein [archaeon]MBT7392418.1 hypothetical protein [archaeon]
MSKHFEIIQIARVSEFKLAIGGPAIVASFKPKSKAAIYLFNSNAKIIWLERLDRTFIKNTKASINKILGREPRGYTLDINEGAFVLFVLD